MTGRPLTSRRGLPGVAALMALALVAAACTSDDGTDDTAGSGAGTAATSDPGGAADASSELVDDPYRDVDYDAEPAGSALRGDPANPGFPPPTVDVGLIRSGGVPPDGIPAIDDPGFIPVDTVGFLSDDEAVIVVQVDDVAKAYPVQILIWHEIVNDTIGDTPVTVTYCPLCNSALAFDRRLGQRVLDFGTSGALYQSALVMYDRQTESLWAHFTGQGLLGHYAGAQLDLIPAQTVAWSQFRDAHPDGLVLSRLSTGASRSYGQNPYPTYDREDTGPIAGFFEGDIDPTLAAKARVVGVADDVGSFAVRLDDLASRPVVPIDGDGRNLVVFFQPGLASALDSFQVDGGRDVGQTGVFVAEAADGTDLTFTLAGSTDDGAYVDDQTGSTWNVLGQAVAGELAGQRLRAVPHVDTFWFAWSTYRPGSVLVDPAP